MWSNSKEKAFCFFSFSMHFEYGYIIVTSNYTLKMKCERMNNMKTKYEHNMDEAGTLSLGAEAMTAEL